MRKRERERERKREKEREKERRMREKDGKMVNEYRDYKVKGKNTTVALVVMVTRRGLLDNEVMIITPVVFFRNISKHSHDLIKDPSVTHSH